jgi:hypothetical protein
MIRGNEAAIDLGLAVLMAVRSDRSCTQAEIAAYIDAAREILGLPTKPFQTQDLFYLEHVAFRKMEQRILHEVELRQIVAQVVGGANLPALYAA